MSEKKKTVVALGGFDGLHKAHKKLIEKTKEYAKEHGILSGVLLFDKLPSEVFLENAKRIMKFSDKKALLDDVDFLYEQKFDAEFMSMTDEDFAKFLVDKLNVRAVCAGFNYRFGKNAKGDISALEEYGKKYGFEVLKMQEYKICGVTVSSTKIREFIENGDMAKAKEFLGREFFMTGKVLGGYGLGRTFGFPTVNLEYDKNSVLPKFGVYSGTVLANGKIYKAVINVGKRPTFQREDVTIESFLLDFSGDLYDKEIKVSFIEFLREEKKFPDASSLAEQINKDIERVKENGRN